MSRLFQGWIKKAWSTARRNVAFLTSKVQDLMYGAKVTKALTQEARSLREFDEVNEQNMQSQIRAETVSVAFSSVVILLSSVMTAAIWYLGGQRVILGAQTIGQLAAFTQYAGWFFEPIQNLAMLYGAIQSAVTGAERIFVVMDQKPEIKEDDQPLEVTEISGEIEFHDVSFSYVEGHPVLRDINLKTVSGEKLAIFGPTGSGKSTIINLLGRFYDPSDGIVSIDGYDVKQLSFKSLRKAVSIVLQEPLLFSGTIEYNLKFGKPDVGHEEMIRVAQLVGIHDAIVQLKDGYQTTILERGSNLSFGQRQLICLARAIIADPKILVFDEATSSVDPYTEARIQETLQREMENRTVILVTHRVSTVRDSDRIIILQDGVIEDDGSHDELIERNDLYRRLCEMQLVTV
jgi:ATP-binding cassette subfamily B protein